MRIHNARLDVENGVFQTRSYVKSRNRFIGLIGMSRRLYGENRKAAKRNQWNKELTSQHEKWSNCRLRIEQQWILVSRMYGLDETIPKLNEILPSGQERSRKRGAEYSPGELIE